MKNKNKDEKLASQGKQENEAIRKAAADGDLWELFLRGLEKFFSLLDANISFEAYMDKLDTAYDRFILQSEQKNNMQCAGGKLHVVLQENGEISVDAALYYRTADGSWNVQNLNNTLSCERITDWKTNPECLKLQKGETLEYTIDPPAEGA